LNYLLDTNAAIAILNAKPETVRNRFARAMRSGHAFGMSSVVLFELWFGVENSSRWEENAEALRLFLASSISIVPFDALDARAAAQIRATLEKAGSPIGPYDLMIAAQAARVTTTLVTANVREYKRVPGLTFEDWSR